MIKNHLKNLLDAGKPAIGIQLRFGTPAIAELAGLAGFDWLLIDTEHAPQTPVTVQAQLRLPDVRRPRPSSVPPKMIRI